MDSLTNIIKVNGKEYKKAMLRLDNPSSPHYVSRDGFVVRTNDEMTIQQVTPIWNGSNAFYIMVDDIEGNHYRIFMDYLVYETWRGNVNDPERIVYIDNDPTHFSVDNLECVTWSR